MIRPTLPLFGLALMLAACSPAGEDASPGATETPTQSSSAPAVGGRAELPQGEGVTPAPEALEGASAAEVRAPLSPQEAARASGGSQGSAGAETGGKLNPSGSNPG